MPELWRHDGETVTLQVLERSGSYRHAERSQALPGVERSALAHALAQHGRRGESAIVAEFRAGLRGAAPATRG